MSEKNINEINQSVETKSILSKSPQLVAAIAGLSLMTQIQAKQVLDEVQSPITDNNTSSLIVDTCEKKIKTDIISIKDSDGTEIAKTLERDIHPELTDYNLSDLHIISNYSFEDKMYLFKEMTTSIAQDYPGNFSNVYDVSSFYVSNHIILDTPCDPNADTETIKRVEQSIISLDGMQDIDKETYFNLLNTIFVKAKMNQSGGELPDNMARTKLEKIITAFTSLSTRQLNIPNVNSDTKELLDKSSTTVSKYNLNIITELAYLENLLMGTQPKVIDRGDGVFYALPQMSQEFMDFLATRDAEKNQFMTTQQINSILKITDQLNKLSTIEAVESVDYKAIEDKFVSYFKSSDLGEEFRGKLSNLSTENQITLLKYFNMGADELGENAGRRDKHFLALRMYDIFEMVNRKEGGAVGTVDMFYDKFPQFKEHEIGKSVNLLAQQADYKEGISADFTPEQKEQLALLRQQIASDRQQIASDRRIIEKIDKLSAVFRKNND